MKIRHVDPIGIVVSDLASAKTFFEDFGFTLLGETEVQGEWVDRITGLSNVKATIVMMQTPDKQLNLEISKFHQPSGQIATQNASANALGLRHMAFVVDDIEGTVGKLKQKGCQCGEVQAYENSYKLCYIRGPEGIIIELAQPM